MHTSLVELSRKLSLPGDKFHRRLPGYQCVIFVSQKSRVAVVDDKFLLRLIFSLESATLTASSVPNIFTERVRHMGNPYVFGGAIP